MLKQSSHHLTNHHLTNHQTPKRPSRTLLCLAVAVALSTQLAYADESQGDEPTVVLAEETIYIDRPSIGTQMTVGRDKLKHRSATLGNALAGELGIHSNPFVVGRVSLSFVDRTGCESRFYKTARTSWIGLPCRLSM